MRNKVSDHCPTPPPRRPPWRLRGRHRAAVSRPYSSCLRCPLPLPASGRRLSRSQLRPPPPSLPPLFLSPSPASKPWSSSRPAPRRRGPDPAFPSPDLRPPRPDLLVASLPRRVSWGVRRAPAGRRRRRRARRRAAAAAHRRPPRAWPLCPRLASSLIGVRPVVAVPPPAAGAAAASPSTSAPAVAPGFRPAQPPCWPGARHGSLFSGWSWKVVAVVF